MFLVVCIQGPFGSPIASIWSKKNSNTYVYFLKDMNVESIPKSIILVLIEKCYSDFFLYLTLYYQTLHVVDGGSSIRKEYVA